MPRRRLTRASYRSAATSRTDEILELLSIQDHGALARRKATHVQGKLTWARLATLAVEALTPPLLRGHHSRGLGCRSRSEGAAAA